MQSFTALRTTLRATASRTARLDSASAIPTGPRPAVQRFALGGLVMAGSLILYPSENGTGAAPFAVASTDTVSPAPAAPVVVERKPDALDSLEAEARLDAATVRRPLERFLGRYNRDRLLVRQVAKAIVRESKRQQVAPSLVAAVLVTENRTLRIGAASSVGAQGLMQVMPMHAGTLGCSSDDLTDVDSNICHGTTILARNLRATRSSSAALLRYNGCVRGTNTPDCHRYPARVLARASRVRREILHSVPDPWPANGVQLAGR